MLSSTVTDAVGCQIQLIDEVVEIFLGYSSTLESYIGPTLRRVGFLFYSSYSFLYGSMTNPDGSSSLIFELGHAVNPGFAFSTLNS